VATRYALIAQLIIPLVGKLPTWKINTLTSVEGVNMQPSRGGEFLLPLVADVVARLTTHFANLKVNVPGYPVLAGDQGLRQG